MNEIIDYVINNWFMIITTMVTGSSVIAKVTGNVTASLKIAQIQKVVDFIAMSSAPTEHKPN